MVEIICVRYVTSKTTGPKDITPENLDSRVSVRGLGEVIRKISMFDEVLSVYSYNNNLITVRSE